MVDECGVRLGHKCQVDAFLSGQKTAEEVARLVQGKMSIYVNEQR